MATRSTKSTGKKSSSKNSSKKNAASSSGGKKKKAAQAQQEGSPLSRVFSVLFFLLLTAGSCTVSSLPSSDEISALNVSFPQKTALMAAREREARRSREELNFVHKPVPFSEISPFLVNALIASEDARFFKHEGVDWKEMEAALKESAKSGSRLRGASTITQQLAKNLYLSENRSPVRKIKELWIARKLEESLSKERLLAVYLNSVEWGDGVFGAEAASKIWFGKSASALTLGEAAALVAMLPNPRRIGPNAGEEWRKRTARVLKRLVAEGKVTRQSADRASLELDAMLF